MKSNWRSIILILLIAPVFSLSGQEGTYYYGVNSRVVEHEEDAFLVKELRKKSEKRFTIKTSRKVDGNWKFETREKIRIQENGTLVIILKSDKLLPDKIYREIVEISPGLYQFKESNIHYLLREGTSSSFLPLHLEGTVSEYYPFEKIKSISEFKDNQLISNRNWLSDGSPYIDTIFYSTEVEPEYQMGDQFFKNYLIQKLNDSDIDLTQIEDKVEIGWVILEDGSMDGIVALKGRSRQLNQFLVNTIAEMPGYWTPAKLNGNTVRYFMSIPLNFMQQEVRFQEVEISAGTMHYNRY